MNTHELLEIDNDHSYGQPEVDCEYVPSVRGSSHGPTSNLLHITQPDGPSFTLDGSELKWLNWTMRLGFNYREGPVIYQLTFDDNGTKRDVAYRMSLAEMVVPYRDPSFDHHRRTAFDIGEWGPGVMTTSLELGCDCLGEIVYVDATLANTRARPTPSRTRFVCMRRTTPFCGSTSTTSTEPRCRQRRMVISCHATVANYEYLIYWRLYQDGNIECEIRATGIMVTTPFPEGSTRHPTERSSTRTPTPRSISISWSPAWT